MSQNLVHLPTRKNPPAVDPQPNFYSPSSRVYSPFQITMFVLEPHLAELVVHKTIKFFPFDLYSEHKSWSPPPLEWNMKGCKTQHIHIHTHHIEVDFLLQFVLADYARAFKCQMSKESLIISSNVLFHAFTKLKQYKQLPENYNSNFKIYC